MQKPEYLIHLLPADSRYWLEEQNGRILLCRKSRPDLPDDENVDYIDCEWAFEATQITEGERQ